MIDVHFTQDKVGQWTQLEIRGHAFFAEAGSDIVCAAVSTLAVTLVNNIERMAYLKPDVQIDEEVGYLRLKLMPASDRNRQQVQQLLMTHTYLALSEDIAKTYSGHVQVTRHTQSTH